MTFSSMSQHLPYNDTVEAAVTIHGLVLDGLGSEHFAAHPDKLKAILREAIGDVFGADMVAWAEQQFTQIYECDPYAFIDRLSETGVRH